MRFLGGVAQAWNLASPEERNKLVRQLFAESSRRKLNGHGFTATTWSASLLSGCQLVPGRKRRDSNPRSRP